MGRIDLMSDPDLTMERRHINAMLRSFEEYELIKSRQHKVFSTVIKFFESKGICKQNFHKYYKRFLYSKRDVSALIPHRNFIKLTFVNFKLNNR